ncbi:Bgt-869 [Blumeria graminis f. sp. tritici]|uniref:Bgt-869 n=2 Tax=Blumeria graminis f. sp. tritici TaxID=62690 RepID=A0A061HH58_BLUGR|nr:Cytoplasmic member of the silencing information regulator [Blumeria graminis f. sp. tritici 96224]VDB86101.1 Bgt-869 [Blumeria graminis f. sp. tritici]
MIVPSQLLSPVYKRRFRTADMQNRSSPDESICVSFPARPLYSNIKDVADSILANRIQHIVVMTGAGISTSAGIPDFRSPGTGLYANLDSLDLPDAEDVFDISYFRENPVPFYTLAKELNPGKFHPTVSHCFINLLNEKALLSMLFTQNIDCLERKAGIPNEKIVEAHGSFATQSCIDCKTQFPDDLMQTAIENGKAPYCLTPQCNGLVKPDIVFFGESLPLSFFLNRASISQADLVIVMGTSLSVQPFASLPAGAGMEIPRVLINNAVVGDFGSRPNDVMILGDCDAGVLELAEALGWVDELKSIWFSVSGIFKEKEAANLQKKKAAMTKDELLHAEIQKLTDEIDTSLKGSRKHADSTYKLLELTSISNDIACTDVTHESKGDEIATATATASSEYLDEDP